MFNGKFSYRRETNNNWIVCLEESGRSLLRSCMTLSYCRLNVICKRSGSTMTQTYSLKKALEFWTSPFRWALICYFNLLPGFHFCINVLLFVPLCIKHLQFMYLCLWLWQFIRFWQYPMLSCWWKRVKVPPFETLLFLYKFKLYHFFKSSVWSFVSICYFITSLRFEISPIHFLLVFFSKKKLESQK